MKKNLSSEHDNYADNIAKLSQKYIADGEDKKNLVESILAHPYLEERKKLIEFKNPVLRQLFSELQASPQKAITIDLVNNYTFLYIFKYTLKDYITVSSVQWDNYCALLFDYRKESFFCNDISKAYSDSYTVIKSIEQEEISTLNFISRIGKEKFESICFLIYEKIRELSIKNENRNDYFEDLNKKLLEFKKL